MPQHIAEVYRRNRAVRMLEAFLNLSNLQNMIRVSLGFLKEKFFRRELVFLRNNMSI